MDLLEKTDARGLRKFGLTTAIILALLFGLFFPWLIGRPMPAWPWIAAAVLALWALAAPRALWWVYRGWMAIGAALGWINTRLILGIVFYLIIVPVGLLMRLFGSDPMRRRPDPGADSYRALSKAAAREGLEKPF